LTGDSERQYKSKLAKWNVGKKIRRNEMKAIVRKRQIRKVEEPDKRDLTFTLRGEVVPEAKVDRWMKRKQIPTDAVYSPSSGAGKFSSRDLGEPCPFVTSSRDSCPRHS
jgi:hypothetical protein